MEDRPQRMVVTGASRGLGLEFTRQWLESGRQVYALARKPEESEGLRELRDRHPGRLWTAACDVGDEASVTAAAEAVGRVWGAVDCLLNNAGVGDRHTVKLADIDWAQLHSVIETNTIGPLRVTRAMLPWLRHGQKARIVNMTSLMGSIGDNRSGGSWGYRISKAALNMATRNLAHELGPENLICIVMHPGWVKTDMGGSRAPLEPDAAIAAMARTIDALEAKHNGEFLDRDGQTLPW